MAPGKADIIVHLEKELLALQGLKHIAANETTDTGLGFINHAFPSKTFPLGSVHEFITEDAGATVGFVAGILSALMINNGVTVWISSSRTLFPQALPAFGIAPEKIIFIDLPKEKDLLWSMEEALKCNGLAAVVAELKELSFTASRRLQLAVEQSGVTGFVLRSHSATTTACVSKWKIMSLPSAINDDLPGIGFPRWNVQLLKIRNGKPGSWQVEWVNGKFRPVLHRSEEQEQQKKTG